MTASPSRQSIVLVTGAARRIGRVIALDFAKRGWNIGLHYNNSQQEIERVAEEIEKLGRKSALLKADFMKQNERDSLIAQCVETLGPPECLINNSSVFLKDELKTLSESQWSEQLDINLKTPVFLAKDFAHYLPEHRKGNIINIIDQRVWKLTPLFFSYTLSKAGLWAATRTLAQSLAPRIRVNAIGPGPVLQNNYQTYEQYENHKKTLPLKISSTPEQISSAIRFILEAPAMTGQMIALDGGQHIAWNTPDVAHGEQQAGMTEL